MWLDQEGLWVFAVEQSEHLGSRKPGPSLPESSGVLGKLCVTATVASLSSQRADLPMHLFLERWTGVYMWVTCVSSALSES